MGRKGLALVAIIVISIASIFNYISVYADDSFSGLTISPARNEINILPGTVEFGEIKVTNKSVKPIDVNLSVEEFNVINQNYDYVFTEDSDIIKWVSFEENLINLSPDESRAIKYYISVPNNAEPGGRYLSLFASTEIISDRNSITSQQRVASLVYINVDGDVSRTGSIVNFNAPWLTTHAGAWSATIRNSGTTHFHSFYTVKLYNLFGNEKWTSTNESMILPASIRLITGSLPDSQIPSVYRVVYKISLGDSPQIEKTRLLFYVPVWFLILVGCLIIGLSVRKFINKTKTAS